MSSWVPGQALLHPAPGAAAALMLVNDYLLRPEIPEWITGKLSDIGICFLLPVVLVVAWEWIRWTWVSIRDEAKAEKTSTSAPDATVALSTSSPGLWGASRLKAEAEGSGAAIHIACAITATYFAILQLSPAFSTAHVRTLTALFPQRFFSATPDVTDLLVLPMVLLAWSYLRRRKRADGRQATSLRPHLNEFRFAPNYDGMNFVSSFLERNEIQNSLRSTPRLEVEAR